jgi:hypothetical protein
MNEPLEIKHEKINIEDEDFYTEDFRPNPIVKSAYEISTYNFLDNYSFKSLNFEPLLNEKLKINYQCHMQWYERSAPNYLRFHSNKIKVFNSPKNEFKNFREYIMLNETSLRPNFYDNGKCLFSYYDRLNTIEIPAEASIKYKENDRTAIKTNESNKEHLNKSICSKSTWKRAEEYLDCIKNCESFEDNNTLAQYLQTDQTDNIKTNCSSNLARWLSEIKILHADSFNFIQNKPSNLIKLKDEKLDSNENKDFSISKTFSNLQKVKVLIFTIFKFFLIVFLNLLFIFILVLCLFFKSAPIFSLNNKISITKYLLIENIPRDEKQNLRENYNGLISLYNNTKYEVIFHRNYEDYQNNKNDN